MIVVRRQEAEIVEGEEIHIKEGEVLYIPSGEKHMTINSSDKDFRYLEFFICPPIAADFVEVK